MTDSEQPFVENGSIHEDRTFRGVTAFESEVRDVEFFNCTFERCTLPQCRFEHCTFDGCRFALCDLGVAKVRNSKVQDTTFTHCKMIGIDWTKLRPLAPHVALAATFDNCTLSYSSFYGMEAPRLVILACVAHEVDFGDADLHDASLARTDLMGSTFLHTNLGGADLRGASNYAIDARHNTLAKARFSLPEAVSLLQSLDIIVE
jgi:fluoroquinolone resistance protein